MKKFTLLCAAVLTMAACGSKKEPEPSMGHGDVIEETTYHQDTDSLNRPEGRGHHGAGRGAHSLEEMEAAYAELEAAGDNLTEEQKERKERLARRIGQRKAEAEAQTEDTGEISEE